MNLRGSHPNRLAAIAPVCGDGRRIEKRDGSYRAPADLPVWTFQDTDDTVVDPKGSTVPVQRLNQCTLPPTPDARLTLFPGVGHESWSLVRDGSGHKESQ